MAVKCTTPRSVVPVRSGRRAVYGRVPVFHWAGLIFPVLFLGCSGLISRPPAYGRLAGTDPAWLTARQDSLLAAERHDGELITALVAAHSRLAEQAAADGRFTAAVQAYDQALELEPDHREARYGRALARGRQLYARGGREDLWEALLALGEAALLDTSQGLPYLWMARSYLKKDAEDFELILETYDRALARSLPEDLRRNALEERADVRRGRQVLEEFWK